MRRNNYEAVVGASVAMLRSLKRDLGESSVGAVFTAFKRARVVLVALTGGRRQLDVLAIN